FLVGLVHGLAGSGALMLAVLATIPSPTVAFAYIAIFGIGSIGGVMVMSTPLGLPFALARARVPTVDLPLRAPPRLRGPPPRRGHGQHRRRPAPRGGDRDRCGVPGLGGCAGRRDRHRGGPARSRGER